MNLLAFCDKIPPIHLRLVARNNGRSMTTLEIARVSGLSRRRVQQMSRSWSWAEFKVVEAAAFIQACGCDLSNRFRTAEAIDRTLRRIPALPKEFDAALSKLKQHLKLKHMSPKEKHEILKHFAARAVSAKPAR